MPKYNKLQQTYFFYVLIINLVTLSFLGGVWMLHEVWQYKAEVKALKDDFEEVQKTIIKNEVENAITYIDKIYKDTENALRISLNLKNEQIFQIVNSINSSHSRYSEKEKQELIISLLKKLNKASPNNFIFIIKPNGIENLNSWASLSNDSLYQELLSKRVNLSKKGNDIYFRHYTIHKNEEEKKEFVLYLKYYEPLDWIIGVGVDYNEFVKERQRDVVMRLAHIRYGKNRDGYLFGNFQNADPLFTNGRITIGEDNQWELEDPHGIKIMQEEHKAAQKPDGDFIQYSWRKIFTEEEKSYGIEKPTSAKISFIKGYKPWNWMIGAGFYLDEIELIIQQKRTALYKLIKSHLLVISISFLFSILGSMLFVRWIQRLLNLSYSRFTDFFNEASKGKAKIDPDSLYFQEFKELALYANKMVEQRELAEQGFRQIVELFPFPICIYNQKNILYVNPQWIKLIGYDITEVPTLPRTLIKCFADRQERKLVSKQGNNPKADNLYKISCKNGQTRYMKLNIISMQDNNSMITLEDYSLRKKIEDDLNAARVKAEESDSLKSAFLANMSHEIRTPMNAIIGFSGLLQNDKLAADKRKRYLELIHKSSESLLNLINDILDISKIEAGQMNFQFIKGDLAETFTIVEAEIKGICETMGKQNIEIIACYDLKNEEGIIETDFLRLKQVLMNLLSNALKFTHEGKIILGCQLLKPDKLKFYVKDTGIGIKPIHLDGIFNRFTKIEEDSTKVFRGAGLGLAISKKIVENLGGTIGVKSVYGEGSEFYFTIPVKHRPHQRKNIVKDYLAN